MKNLVLIITSLLMLSLAACSNQNSILDDTQDNGKMQPESMITLDDGVWPENEYTEGLPIPQGTVQWTFLDTEHKNCSINISDMSEAVYNDYMQLLKQEGFSEIENISEEIRGQDYVSEAVFLSNGEKWLSISYIPNNFGIYITFLEEN